MRSVLTCVAFVALMVAAVPAGPLPGGGVTVAVAASPELDEAQRLYDQARFDDAAARLRDALASGTVTGPDALRARELLGRSLVKAGDRVGGKEAFKSLLRVDSGYRLDAVRVPPDEMEVFNQALAEVTAEQIEAGRRVPASIGFNFGIGSGKNEDFGEVVEGAGGDPELDSKPQFGGSVRFPLRPRLSLDIELMRFRATGEDTFPAPNTTKFEATALPLIVSAYWTVIPANRYRVNVFAGGGPMLASRASIDLQFFTVRLSLADEKVGAYFHAGVEGEYLIGRRFSVSGRALVRSAKATDLFEDLDPDVNFNDVELRNREVNFSGFGAYLGVRAYIGY